MDKSIKIYSLFMVVIITCSLLGQIGVGVNKKLNANSEQHKIKRNLMTTIENNLILTDNQGKIKDIDWGNKSFQYFYSNEKYKEHNQIKIDNDTDFKNTAQSENWKGNGSINDPYIIEGLDIANPKKSYGIYIGNTTVHFKIKDCYVHYIFQTEKIDWMKTFGVGIYLKNVKNGELVNNKVSSIGGYGIFLDSSSNIALNNNILENNYHGVNIFKCTNIKMQNNILNKDYITIRGDQVRYWNTHEISNTNKVNGKKVIYLKDNQGGEIQGNMGQLIMANCTEMRVHNVSSSMIEIGLSANNIIRDNRFKGISREEYGIDLYYSDNNKLDNNSVQAKFVGIHLSGSDFNKISYGYLTNNSHDILLRGSDNNIIRGCKLFGNYTNSNGIYITGSKENVIKNNSISNRLEGIHIETSSDENEILRNKLKDNKRGISIIDSKNNMIHYNDIINNKKGVYLLNSNSNIFNRNTLYENSKGIIFSEANNNYIYLNNIVMNNEQVYSEDESSYDNYWNNNDQRGNYWSDYEGVDNGSHGRTAGDGIGDTEIPHPEEKKVDGYYHLDNYPLIEPINFYGVSLNIINPVNEKYYSTSSLSAKWENDNTSLEEIGYSVGIDKGEYKKVGKEKIYEIKGLSDGKHKLTVRMNIYGLTIEKQSVHFNVDTKAPTSDAGEDQTVKVDEEITFDASDSSDNIGITSHEWDFDDGTTATGETVTHKFDEKGTYEVTLTVTDEAGNTDTDTVTVTVEKKDDNGGNGIPGFSLILLSLSISLAVLNKYRKKTD